MRTLSGHVFPVKTWAGRLLGVVGGLGCLPEAGLAQAAITAEKATGPAEDGAGGDGRQLIAAVRFVERTVSDAMLNEPVQTEVQLMFVGDAANNEMRMLRVLRQEAGGFDSGVTGLDDLLRVGKIVSDEDVNVWRFRALVEGHGILLQCFDNRIVY